MILPADYSFSWRLFLVALGSGIVVHTLGRIFFPLGYPFPFWKQCPHSWSLVTSLRRYREFVMYTQHGAREIQCVPKRLDDPKVGNKPLSSSQRRMDDSQINSPHNVVFKNEILFFIKLIMRLSESTVENQ